MIYVPRIMRKLFQHCIQKHAVRCPL